MWPAAIAFAIFFAIFAAVEWSVVAGVFGRSVDDVFDLTFLLFQAFWALGWSVGVLLLGALTVLFAFYSESARIENGRLVHVPKLGPLAIVIDYDLAKVRNVRLEQAGGNDPDTVQVRFDYEGGANALGNPMPRAEGQRIVDAITGATRFAPRAIEAPRPPREPQQSTQRPYHCVNPRRDFQSRQSPLSSRTSFRCSAYCSSDGISATSWCSIGSRAASSRFTQC